MKTRIKSRIPTRYYEFNKKYIIPYVVVFFLAIFTVFADYAKAAEVTIYEPSEPLTDLAPAEVANIVSVLDPYTPDIQEDPVTVALAVDDQNFLDKPVLAETQVTDEPKEKQQTAQKSNQKRTRDLTYTVDPGDTLSKIGWQYGLRISTIMSYNGLRGETIKPGQKLKLPPQDLSPTRLADLSVKRVAGTYQQAFTGIFRRPVSGWALTQVFGHTGFENWHTGVDLSSRSGTTIFASASGRVYLHRGWGGGYGNHITIEHGNGYTTLYGHMSSFSVANGQWVNQGQPIGIMGSTGWSTGTHLHFEIRKGGAPQNPLNYL